MLFRRFSHRRAASVLSVSTAAASGHLLVSPTVSARRLESARPFPQLSKQMKANENWAQNVVASLPPDAPPEGVQELPQEDVDFANVELRTLLIGKGEVPIGAVPQHLSERTRDILSKIGGLGNFCDTHGKKMFSKLTHSSGVILIMNRHYAPNSFVNKMIEIIKSNGGNQEGGAGIPLDSLFARLPNTMRQYMNLKTNRFAPCLRSHPEIFAVSEDRRLVAVQSLNPRFPENSNKPIQGNFDEILSSGTHAVHIAGYNEETKRGNTTTVSTKGTSFEARHDVNPALHGMLVDTLPSSCFVPLSEVIKRLHTESLSSLCHNCWNQDDPLASLMKRLQSLPVNIVDIRALGESPDQVFVRLVADRMALFSRDGDDGGEERFTDYNVNHLGHDIAEAFREAGCEETTIADLPNILPKELLDQFPLQGPPAILVFDRMQHLFDVDNVNFAVRLRRKGEPFSASMNTTPVPQAVRYFAYTYSTPVSIESLAEHMPSFVTSEIFATFGSVKSFIAAHRLYVFVQQGGLVYTPSIVSMEQGSHGVTQKTASRNPQLDHLKSPQSVANHIHSLLPHNRYVGWLSWSDRQHFPQALYKLVDTPEPAMFFQRFPDQFNICYQRGSNMLMIGKADIPLPKYIWPKCESLMDCLKELAYSALGGSLETIIHNSMSREGRMITRAFGGMETLCRQIPQWFEVSNRAGIHGQCFITYIGHLRENEKKAAIAEAAIKARSSVEQEPLPKTAHGKGSGKGKPPKTVIVNRRSA